MANADFSQKQNSTSGGFDAGSYREQKKPEQAVPLTPLQQKLAGLEAKLPAALSTRAAALALSVVVMLAALLAKARMLSSLSTVRVSSSAAGTTKSANGTRWVWRQTTAITSTRS